MKARTFAVVMTTLLCTATASPLAAQGAAAGGAVALEPLATTWRFEVMPYVWGAGMSGRIRPFTGAPTVSFSRSFSEILEEVDAALFVAAEAHKGHAVLLADASRITTSREGTLAGALPAEARTRQTMVFVAGGWRAAVSPRHQLDLFVGARSVQLDVDLRIAGGLRSASPRRSFVDPVVGARAAVALTPRWTGRLHADVGGFGVGSESTVTLQALTDVALSKRFALTGGYRAMFLDYDDKGTLADVTLGGLLAGLRVRF